MKNIIRLIGLCSFIVFSFFYTDKVLNVVKEEDRIMIELNKIKEYEYVKPINAKIENDTIVPGINGKKINVEKSYKNMRSIGMFDYNSIVYDTIVPEISMTKNKDKYLVLGNPNKQWVSIIMILDNNKYLSKIEKIVEVRNITLNYFVNYQYLVNNTTKIKEMNKGEFYNYGDNGVYTPDNILFANNLISRITNHYANLCLCEGKNKSILELCSKNDLYTIVPNIVVTKFPYSEVKKNLTNGSIILFYLNKDTIEEVGITIDYIKGKGYQIVGLSSLISESY